MSMEQNFRTPATHVRRLALDAVLAALFVLFAVVFTIKTPVLEISWASLPILVAALLFGLPDALAVALIGSFMEQALSQYGLSPTTPLWMAPVLLQAFVAGLFAHLARRTEQRWILIFAVIAAELVLTAANIAALYLDGAIYSYALPALHLMVPGRLLNAAVRTALSVILLPPLLLALRRILGQRREHT